MNNPSQTIITQYQASPIINTLLSNWNVNLDPVSRLVSFYNTIWNIATASGYGLDVWGRIVGVVRTLQVPQTFNYFGFQEATGTQPFNYGTFYTGGGVGTTTTALTLTDAVFRQLILLKARANITNCSGKDLNALLAALYAGRGQCYVADNGNMRFTYVFKFFLTPSDYTLLAQSGVLPRPAGTTYSILQGF
jgi:hypothetical protein